MTTTVNEDEPVRTLLAAVELWALAALALGAATLVVTQTEHAAAGRQAAVHETCTQLWRLHALTSSATVIARHVATRALLAAVRYH